MSEIPYVGAMFRKVKETRNETRVLALVRCEIVRPDAAAPAGQSTASGPAASQTILPTAGQPADSHRR